MILEHEQNEKIEKITYWVEHKNIVHKVDCTNALKEEKKKDGNIIYKQNKQLIKEITQGVNRGYIPQPYRGNKRMQLANGDR